ncbi:MAG: class I SAM-dependent methyltransferase [Cyclobacteriaceae bacterium]
MIKKLIPSFVKDYIYEKVIESQVKARIRIENAIPKYDLEAKHLCNTKILKDRQVLIEQMPHYGIAAELGVDQGQFSEKILDRNEPGKLYLIDVWKTNRYHEGLMEKINQRFSKEIDSGQVELIRDYSTSAVNQFEDDYFDWIYIDTDHSYEVTKRELEAYAPKIKKSGLIAGHDFVTSRYVKNFRYGVIEAVYEFCINHNWELIFLTMENTIPPSFAIKRIQ